MAVSQKDYITKGMAQFSVAGGEDFDPEEGAPALPEIGNVQDLRADSRIF